MSKRPLKHLALREQLLAQKSFIKKINRTKTPYRIKALINSASPEQVRMIQCLILAHFDQCQGPLPIPESSYDKLRRSKSFKFLSAAFSPKRTLNALHEARLLLLKIAPLIRIFTQNCTH